MPVAEFTDEPAVAGPPTTWSGATDSGRRC